MSDEKSLRLHESPKQANSPNVLNTPSSATGFDADDKILGDPEKADHGSVLVGRHDSFGSSGLGYDPRDTTLDQWTLEKHLRAVINESQKQNLPPMSSKSSVIFKDLSVRGAGAGVTYQPTVGEILSRPATGIKKLKSRGKAPEKTILHSMDGVVRDGEMLLVLGRPGSGCSTLLKTLAGLTEEYLGWKGEVKYNGVDIDIIKTRFRGDVVFTSEVDVHFPYISVEHTLDFALETKTPRARLEGESRKESVKSMTDVLATALGIRHALQTGVGNDFVRGVSGGERKRVSLAETLATRASVCYWDNPTRGLDASTSLEFIRVLRTMTTQTHSTAVVALYQAGETLTQEFDKVTVLYLGRQIFFGRVADAKIYFEELGFVCKPRQTTADFLTAITDPVARRVKDGWQTRAPRSPEDFVRVWKNSSLYSQLKKDIDKYGTDFSQSQLQIQEYSNYQSTQKAKHQRAKSPYIVNIRMQFIANLKRAYYRMIGDKIFLSAMAFSAIFMSLIMGSLFYSLPNSTSGYFSKSGVLFFAILFNALQTMSEIGTQYAQRPIVQRQAAYAMYHPFVDALATLFAEYPYKVITVSIFDIVIYFMANLKQDASAFFIFWVTTYLATLVMSGYFKTIAAVTKQPETALGLAGVSVLVFAVYTGYVIPRTSMHPWFKWLSYIDPLSYAFEALMANEFHNAQAPCSNLIPSGPGYLNASPAYQVCAVTGAKPGQRLVSGDDYIAASFDYHYSHVGRNIGILCAFLCGFIFAFALATEFNSLSANKGDFLIFRRGHLPENMQKVLEESKTVDDIESQEYGEPLTDARTNTSQVRGLVKSQDVFTWEGVTYDISLSDGHTRRLLNDISGYVKPGTLTALMGESGAGKTTLLNVLAERVDVGVVGGQPLVNGAPPGRSFQRRTGYVQQQDLHLGESTVREALRFSAVLRQPKDVPLQEKLDYVEKVIEILEMQDYAEAIIGTPGNGLNVEQRKRTTIGVELVGKPALLLFLDEPTSGLDSQSAWSIVRFLRKLADSGQAILCTIHQPSAVLIDQFDRLLLLKKGGQTVYFGDIGHHSRTIIDYFESNGAFHCPPDANPAEYMLDVIGAGATAHVDRDWHEIWKQTLEHKQVLEEIQALKEEYAANVGVDHSYDASKESNFAASWLTQYGAVQLRIYQSYWRNPTYVMGKVMLNVVAGLFLGFTFYKEDRSAQGLQNKLFAIFMATILGFPLMNQLQPQFIELTKVYIVREKPSKMYHWSTFILSTVLTEIPYNLITGTLFFFPWYFAVGYYHDWTSSINEPARGVYMWLMLMFFEMWFSTFGLAMAALSPNAETAATFTTLFASFVVAFNGVLQPLGQLVNFWHWVYYLSPYTWLIGGMMSTAVHGVSIECATKEINHFNPPPGQTCGEYAGPFVEMMGNLLNRNATSDCMYCRYATSDEYLRTVNMDFGDHWRNMGLMAVYVLFNIGMAFTFFYITKIASWNFSKLAILKSKKKSG